MSDHLSNTAASVAKWLGLHPGQICNWRRQFSRLSENQLNSLASIDCSKAESEEVRQLKRELNEAQKEKGLLQGLLRASRIFRSEVRNDRLVPG